MLKQSKFGIKNTPGESIGLKFIQNQSELSESFQNLYPHQTVSF